MYMIIKLNYVIGYLMAGIIVSNSDRHLYSQSNAQLQNDFSANNTSSDKDKTPMCLVNELARFNKV